MGPEPVGGGWAEYDEVGRFQFLNKAPSGPRSASGVTRFFSPLSMNLPPGAAGILGDRLPPDDALLTGSEFVDGVLVPLAASEVLAGRIQLGHRVVAVGRSGLTKLTFAAPDANRAAVPITG